jgi:hypothetical protein
MAKQYKPTGDVEALLAALQKQGDTSYYDSLAKEEKVLEERIARRDQARAELKYQESQVVETEGKIAMCRRKTAQIINTLGKLGCPEELIKEQWQSYDKKFKLPWPNGHDLANWIKEE